MRRDESVSMEILGRIYKSYKCNILEFRLLRANLLFLFLKGEIIWHLLLM